MKRLILLSALLAMGIAEAQVTESPGPTILSRGLGTIFQGGGELLRLKPFLSVNAAYESGLTPVSLDAAGQIPSDNDYGADLSFGVVGYRSWRRSVLGIDYRGNVRHYARNTYYDGSDHTVTLGFTHRPTRRLTVSLREAAGTYSRSYGSFSANLFFDPAFADVPANEMFDGRTTYMSTLGDLTFQKSPRLSFNIGGSGMVVRRRSKALVGVTGWTGRSDVAYRVGRRATIGVDYNFTHYEFTNAFGASDIHTTAVNFAFQLGRNWNLGLRAGGSRVETLGLQRVGVDPIIAAIIGRSSGIEAIYRLNYVPAVEARLARVFRRSVLSFRYESGVNAGNGLYLTSRTQNGGVGYSYTASERWNVGFDTGYSSYSSLGQTMGKYGGYNGGVGVSVRLMRWMHLVSRYSARRYEVSQAAAFRRLQHSASLGIAFSPGEVPLSLW